MSIKTDVVLPANAVVGTKGKVKPFTSQFLTAAEFAVCPNSTSYFEVVAVKDSEIEGIFTKITSLNIGGGVGTARLKPLEVGGAVSKSLPSIVINSSHQKTKEVEGKWLFVWWNATDKVEVFAGEVPSGYKGGDITDHLNPDPENCYPSFRQMVVEDDGVKGEKFSLRGTLEECLQYLKKLSGESTPQSFVAKAMILAGVGSSPKKQLAVPPGFE